MTNERRSILITGCSEGGIGAAVALEHHTRGYHVFASARNTAKIAKSLSSLPYVTAIELDVTSTQSIAAAAERISRQTGGRLDVLFNNAGSSLTYPTLHTSISEARDQFDLHVLAPLAMIQAFFPFLMRGEMPVIMNNSSIAGETNLPWQSVYGASKAAITNLGETLRLEVQPLGVRVVTVVTGIIETRLHEKEVMVALPDESWFKGLEEWLGERKEGTNRPKGMSVQEYAKQLVDNIESGANGKVFIGPLTSLFVWMKWWCPTWIWDGFMVKSGPPRQTDLIRKGLEGKA